MDTHHVDVAPLAAALERRVEVRASTVHLSAVTVNRAAVVEYLRTIALDKQEMAVVHAIEVGVAEILSRRRLATPRR